MTDTNCQRASQSLYETIAQPRPQGLSSSRPRKRGGETLGTRLTISVSLFARLPPRALLAASPLARDSCSTTFSVRIFEQKRDADSCSTTFSLRNFEQKRDCSQSINRQVRFIWKAIILVYQNSKRRMNVLVDANLL